MRASTHSHWKLLQSAKMQMIFVEEAIRETTMDRGYTRKLRSQQARFSALPLTTCMTVDKLLTIPRPQLPHRCLTRGLRCVLLSTAPGALAAPRSAGCCCYKTTAIPSLPWNVSLNSWIRKKYRCTIKTGKKSQYQSTREEIMEYPYNGKLYGC